MRVYEGSMRGLRGVYEGYMRGGRGNINFREKAKRESPHTVSCRATIHATTALSTATVPLVRSFDEVELSRFDAPFPDRKTCTPAPIQST